ncbi:uncharacterized protein LOC144703455 isoform X2 [Wolffia australiana]
MENMAYAEELLREFLVFRGFTGTLQAFESELMTDIGKDFQVDKLLDLVFSGYIPKFQADKLVSLLSFFKHRLCSDSVLASSMGKLELSILRYYVVYALQSGRADKVIEFFGAHGDNLLQRRDDWSPWFAIPYLKNPNLDPQFRVYFSREWLDALRISFRNFLSAILNGARIPGLLKISTEKNAVKHLKNDIKQMNTKLSQLQALLEEKDAELSLMRSIVPAACETSKVGEDSPTASHTKGKILSDKAGSSDNASIVDLPSSFAEMIIREGEEGNVVLEEDFPEVKVDFQETFLGHTSPITKCRFSAGGTNIASASVDGTVRIWTYNSTTPTSRNATIYCGAEIMSLDWECRSDRLLVIGTANGGIKAWNVDAKRVVCDLSTSSDYPSVLDLKCSPVEPIFVSAAASRRYNSGQINYSGFASLTVWNMKSWKATSVLPLGKDPPVITSLCFNHNGKILAASAADGMIHIFDMSANLQITGWPAHDSSVCSVRFGSDETSIFSLGSDGKLLEWSLHNQGKILWSRDCSRFCNLGSSRLSRHEIGLDSDGKKLLVTSNSVRSPIFQLQGQRSGLRTLAHSSAITTVDWHPTLPIFLTGSADHSVRVTSMG